MALSDQGKAALAYWGTIRAASAARLTTQQLWASIRAEAERVPGGAPLPSLQGVNEIRQAATQIRTASEQFQTARDTSERYGLTQAITSTMMATDINARTPQVLTTLADYYVRFQAEFTTPLGASVTQWITAKYGAGELPATVGDLVDALGSFGASNYSGQGLTFDNVGPVEITAH